MDRDESGVSDPALSPERLGERSVTLRMDHEAALSHVRDVFGEVGFSFPTEFSPSERIGEERDADPEPYTVVGLGVPAAGEHALEAGGKRVGALFPCSVVVRETGPGVQEVYHLSVMQVAQAIGIAPDDERWGALVAQVQSMIDDAFADLGKDVAGRHRGIDG
ncbi:MAG: DUF302 domain-containing protein [Haloarculaceae archaeon]